MDWYIQRFQTKEEAVVWLTQYLAPDFLCTVILYRDTSLAEILRAAYQHLEEEKGSGSD